jgi:protein-disulfide isomerase/uncharacterized membrane protein
LKKNVSLLNYIGICISIIGLVLSFMLIQEYYGTKTQLAGSICTATGEEDSCKAVAESNYSGIKNVPLLGSVPVATLGFTFYGFLLCLFIIGLRSKSDEEANSLFNQLFLFSVFAIIVDVALFLVSKLIIGKVCTLCFLTYIVTLLVLVISVLGLKKTTNHTVFTNLGGNFMKTFLKNSINYTIIVLAFFACGMGVGQYSQADKNNLSSSEEPIKFEIEGTIKAYDATPAIEIDLTDVPMLGDPAAKITIVKYADFNCGHCMHASHSLKLLLAEFTGLIKVYYKNFPLDGNCNPAIERKSVHASSCVAASAALCGNTQGKFYEVYTSLYEDTEKGVLHSPVSVLNIAKKSALNIEKFNACMGSAKVREQINREAIEGDQKLKIQSTPSLFINNKPLPPGNPNIELLRSLIKHLINKV